MLIFEDYFVHTVPSKLKQLREGQTALWGSMTVDQMVDHLRIGLDISVEGRPAEIITPAGDLPAYKRFLLSDKPFKPGAARPALYDEVAAYEGASLEAQKINLMKSLVHMLVFFEKNPEHSAIHPNFGELNVEEWLHLHHKHFEHHFKQFGLS